MKLKPFYNRCLEVVSRFSNEDIIRRKDDLVILPTNVLFDVLYGLHLKNRLFLFSAEFKDVRFLDRFLTCHRSKLLRMYNGLHVNGEACDLVSNYVFLINKPVTELCIGHIDLGLRLAAFLIQGGYYDISIHITLLTVYLCRKFDKSENILIKLLECYSKKLYAEVSAAEGTSGFAFSRLLTAAENTYKQLNLVITDLKKIGAVPNMATVYSNFSYFYWLKGDNRVASDWSKRALELIDGDTDKRITIKVFRFTYKSLMGCNRVFQAGVFIRRALAVALEVYRNDKQHPYYADTLRDYTDYISR